MKPDADQTSWDTGDYYEGESNGYYAGSMIASNIDFSAFGNAGLELVLLQAKPGQTIGNFGAYVGTCHLLDSGIALTSTAWHHVAVTKDANGIHTYVDGVAGNSFTDLTCQGYYDDGPNDTPILESEGVSGYQGITRTRIRPAPPARQASASARLTIRIGALTPSP